MAQFDTIVLGGGIIGASVAEELARRGSRVALIERGAIGGEASKAAAGILSAQMDVERPGPFLDLCQAARGLYPSWIKRVERASGIGAGFRRHGVLYLTATKTQTRQMDARMRWQRRQGLSAQRLSPAGIRRLEPHVTAEAFDAGFFFPDEGEVDNAVLMDALAAACRAAGVTVFEQTEVTQVCAAQCRVQGVRTSRGEHAARSVVNCLGSWSPLTGLPVPRPQVIPAKGQMLAFEAARGLLRRPVMSERAYGVQRRDGRLIVGSTVEFVGYDKRLSLAGMSAILSGFTRMIDAVALEACRLQETWVGLRPYSLSQSPILGPTAVEGLWVATGHFRHGILLAPVTAAVIADLVLTGRSAVDLAPFGLDGLRRARRPGVPARRA